MNTSDPLDNPIKVNVDLCSAFSQAKTTPLDKQMLEKLQDYGRKFAFANADSFKTDEKKTPLSQ